MQSLTNSDFTVAEVVKALQNPNVLHSFRVEVDGPESGEIDTVTGLSITQEGEREIKKTLSLDFVSTSSIPVLFPFRSRVKVFSSIHIGSRSIEWEVGNFLWIDGSQPLTASINIPISSVLPEWGLFQLKNERPVGGYSVSANTNLSSAIATIIDKLDLPHDLPSTVFGAAETSWSNDRTYLEIINELLKSGGFYTLFAKGDGTLTSQQIPDFSTADASFLYTADESSILADAIMYEPSISDAVNRQIVNATNSDLEHPFSVAAVAANEYPYSMGRIGIRLDANPISDDVSSTPDQLIARAAAELRMKTQRFDTLEGVTTRAVPPTEDFDIIEFFYPGSSKFSAPTTWQITAYTFDVANFVMTHTWHRIIENTSDVLVVSLGQ
jgi:hypothetical protein